MSTVHRVAIVEGNAICSRCGADLEPYKLRPDDHEHWPHGCYVTFEEPGHGWARLEALLAAGGNIRVCELSLDRSEP